MGVAGVGKKLNWQYIGVFVAEMEIPGAQPKRRLITKILMLIFEILTIRILLISIIILLANIGVPKCVVNKKQPLVLLFSK